MISFIKIFNLMISFIKFLKKKEYEYDQNTKTNYFYSPK